ncbi:MAG: hypothetical protein JKY33_00335 [Bacteroidia bacterium]|nr:hypothetical protein [Bacteroidia bacterium]
MSLFNGIKKSIGSSLCKANAESSKVVRIAVNFDDAKRVGIIYDATDSERFEIVKEYAKEIRESGKEVKALGFVNDKQTGRHQLPTIDLDFFTLKDLNWYLKPSGHTIRNFINGDHDILICLDMEGCLPLQFIAGSSKAKYRVGKYDPKNQSYYDLMIDLQKNENLSYFIEQVNHYINLINKKEDAG